MKSLKNNLFMLGMVWQASKRRIIWQFFDIALECVIDVLYTLFFLRFLISCMEREVSYPRIAGVVLLYFAANTASRFVGSHLNNVVIPETDVVIQSHLMDAVYKQALTVDLSCYENPVFYDTYTQANEEVLSRTTAILDTAGGLIYRLISMVGYGAAVLAYEPVLLPIMVVSLLVTQAVKKRYVDAKYTCRKETISERRKMDYVKRVVYLQDYAKELRLTHIFTPVLKAFHQAAEDNRRLIGIYGKRAGLYRIVSSVISSLTGYLATQGFIIYRYLVKRAYSFGLLTTILNAASGLSDSLDDLVWLSAAMHENGVFIENFRIFLNYQPKMLEKKDGLLPAAGGHELTLKNVSFTYEGAKQETLKRLNLTIPAGQKIALVGHNGAGKSTLVKLLMRLYDATEGAVFLDGTDIREYEAHAYRGQFATVFQDYKVFAASVAENVLLRSLEGEDDRRKVEEALKASGIYERVMRLPKGMDTILTKEFDEDGALLSGGELQKLAIARVFAKNSSIAILDEPSSALDPVSEYEVFENMMKACEGKTVIFVSHRLSSATMADRIYLLEQGEIVEEGTHHELMERGGKYAEMFLMQAEKYREEGIA